MVETARWAVVMAPAVWEVPEELHRHLLVEAVVAAMVDPRAPTTVSPGSPVVAMAVPGVAEALPGRWESTGATAEPETRAPGVRTGIRLQVTEMLIRVNGLLWSPGVVQVADTGPVVVAAAVAPDKADSTWTKAAVTVVAAAVAAVAAAQVELVALAVMARSQCF